MSEHAALPATTAAVDTRLRQRHVTAWLHLALAPSPSPSLPMPIETHLWWGVRGKGALPPETQAARSAHPGGSAALHIERYFMVRVCRA